MLLATKLRHQIQALDPNIVCQLKNIRLNGRSLGCSGFVTNPGSGRVAYVSTEKSPYKPMSRLNLYRKAKDTRDFSGGMNHFAADDELATKLVAMVAEPQDPSSHPSFF